MKSALRGMALAGAGLGALFLVSAPLFYKKGGWLAVLVYFGLCFAVLAQKKYVPAFKPATAVVCVVLVAFSALLLLHSYEEGLEAQGKASDRGDALLKASNAMLAGQNPYAQKTFLGNLITPLPGALILAAPFVRGGGHLALQTVLWLALFFALLGSRFGGVAQNRALLVLLLSLVVFQDLLQGGDYIANALYVCVFAVAWARAEGAGTLWLWSAGLGLSMASRPSYWIVPLLFYPALREARGTRTASLALALAALVAVAVTAPFIAVFYPGDVLAFPPFHVFDKYAMDPWEFFAALAVGVPLILLGFRSFRLHHDGIIDACAKFSLLLCALVLGGFAAHVWAAPAEAGFNGTFYLTQASCVWPFALLVACAQPSRLDQA